MVSKLKQAEVSAAKIDLSTFREAVNYQNTKNKGYVRFIPDGKGGVTIGKVNNKLDIFGVNGFRTNTGPEYNKKLREKLSGAMLPGLRWIGSDRKDSIRSLIAGVSDGSTAYSTMALSRKELMKIFAQYDHELNTASGRTMCMNRLIQSAADKCGVDRKVFFNVYLRPLMSDEVMQKYEHIADVNVSDVTKMVWNESAFINFMSCLDALCNTALVKLDIEKTLKNSIVPVINQRIVRADGAGHISDTISKEDLDRLRGDLLPMASHLINHDTEHCDASFNMRIYGLFIDEVIPGIYKNVIENSGDYDDKEAYINAQLSADKILEHLKRFFKETHDYLASDRKYKVDDENIQANKPTEEELRNMSLLERQDRNLGVLAAAVDKMNEKTGEVIIQQIAGGAYVLYTDSTAVPLQLSNELKTMFQSDVESTHREALLSLCPQIYLRAHNFLPVVVESTKEDEQLKILRATEKNLAKEAEKIATALAVKFGEAEVNDIEKRTRIKTKFGVNDMVNLFRDNNIVYDIAKDSGATDPTELKEYLDTHTLPNIINRKIESYSRVRSLDITQQTLNRDIEAMRIVSAAYVDGEQFAKGLIASKSNAFMNMVEAHLKKNNLRKAQVDSLRQQAAKVFAMAHATAKKEYFLRSPYLNLYEAKKAYRLALNNALSEAISQLNSAMSIAVLANATNMDIAETSKQLMNVREQVEEYVSSKQDSDFDINSLMISASEVKDCLRMGALPRLYNEVLSKKLAALKTDKNNKGALPDSFLSDVQSDFKKAADKLVKQYVESGRRLVESFAELVNGQLELLLNNDKETIVDLKGYEKYCSHSQKKQMQVFFTNEVLRLQSDNVRKELRNLLLSSVENSKKSAAEAAGSLFNEREGDNTVYNSLQLAIADHKGKISELCGSMKINGSIHAKLLADPDVVKFFPKECKDTERIGILNLAYNLVVKKEIMSYPLAYVMNEEQLLDKIYSLCKDVVKEFHASYETFRRKFMSLAPEMEKNINLDSETRTFAEIREDFLYELLIGIQDMSQPLMKPEDAVVRYRATLFAIQVKTVEDREKMIFEYQEKVSAAYNYFMPKVDDEIASVVKTLTAANVSQKVIDYFIETIAPKIKHYYEIEIYTSPDRYSEESNDYLAIWDELNASVGACFNNVFRFNNPRSEEGLDTLVWLVGRNDICRNDTYVKQSKEILSQWLSTEAGKLLKEEADIALLDYCFVNRLSYKPLELGEGATEAEIRAASRALHGDFLPGTPDNAVVRFRNEAREQVKQIASQFLFSAEGILDNDSIGVAYAQFSTWLDSFMPGRAAMTADVVQIAKDKIMKMFYTRVANLCQESVANERREPILSESFIKEIERVIDEEATLAVFNEIRANKAKECFDFLSVGYGFKTTDINGNVQEFDENVKAIIELNREHLETIINVELMGIQLSLDSNDSHSYVMETLEINRELLGKKFEETFQSLTQKESESIKDVLRVSADRFDFESNVNSIYAVGKLSFEQKLVEGIRYKNSNKFLGSIKTRDASVSNLRDLAQKNSGYDALQRAVDKLINAFTGQLDELVARGRDEYWNDQMLQKAVEELVEKQLKDIVYKNSNDYKIIMASLTSLDRAAVPPKS